MSQKRRGSWHGGGHAATADEDRDDGVAAKSRREPCRGKKAIGQAGLTAAPPWRSGVKAKEVTARAEAEQEDGKTDTPKSWAWRLTTTVIRDTSSEEYSRSRESQGESKASATASSAGTAGEKASERPRCHTKGCQYQAHSDESFGGLCCWKCPSGGHGKRCEASPLRARGPTCE